MKRLAIHWLVEVASMLTKRRMSFYDLCNLLLTIDLWHNVSWWSAVIVFVLLSYVCGVLIQIADYKRQK